MPINCTSDFQGTILISLIMSSLPHGWSYRCPFSPSSWSCSTLLGLGLGSVTLCRKERGADTHSNFNNKTVLSSQVYLYFFWGQNPNIFRQSKLKWPFSAASIPGLKTGWLHVRMVLGSPHFSCKHNNNMMVRSDHSGIQSSTAASNSPGYSYLLSHPSCQYL